MNAWILIIMFFLVIENIFLNILISKYKEAVEGTLNNLNGVLIKYDNLQRELLSRNKKYNELLEEYNKLLSKGE